MGNETAESLRRSWAQYRLDGSGKEGKKNLREWRGLAREYDQERLRPKIMRFMSEISWKLSNKTKRVGAYSRVQITTDKIIFLALNHMPQEVYVVLHPA